MVTELARLPGVSFEAPPPRRQETLPRMDIAAFAGFAATGPLHVPVAIESPRRFRDLFGDDPRLAWDPDRGEVRTGYLGRAVEAFFANGGRRCWIVRVADDTAGSPLARHEFEIPGLIHAADRADSPPTYVHARARAAGSWCEGLAAGAVLLRDPLPLAAGAASLALDVGAYRIDFAAGAARLAPGDLVEITFGPGGPVLLLFAARVTTIAGGVRVESAGLDVSGETEGAYWIQPASPGSPALGIDPETLPPEPLTEAAGRVSAIALLQASPTARPVARRLSFELLVFNGKELQSSLGELTFCSRHPRYWGALPTDEELFRARPDERVAPEPSGLARDAAAPRFPLAGPAPPAVSTPAVRYDVPWGMGRTRTADAARALPIEATANTDAIERDGLAAFGPALFLDPHLGRLYTGALLGEGEHRLYVAQIPLKGVHSLLPIEEVSLVAAPDAAHRGWDRELPPQPLPLGAPILDPIAEPDAAGRYPATWSAVEGADSYQLQQDTDPALPSPAVVFEGAEQATAVVLPDACPRDLFFRVRAAREGEVGPWSNTRAARLPREDFALCEQVRPPALVLEFSSASPAPALTWTTEDPAESLPAEWDLMEAIDAGFANQQRADLDGVTPGFAPLPARRFAPRYYRVRGVANGLPGVWSNTVFVPATERATYTEVAARSFEAGALLAIHRALLRFAAARGDFLALLSLPDFHRAADAIAHAALLTPGGPEEEPAPATGPLRVPPLTDAESTVLSYGALYHPWTIARSVGQDDEARPLRLSPPDGAIAGLMAAVAANEGAWIAPANRPLNGILALQPPLDVETWRRLVPARVNGLIHDARGFLTRSEDTLGGERALGRVHVRRLMILLRRLALREGERFVFEPNSRDLRLRIRHTFERLMDQLFRRGAFDGTDAASAFRVVTDDTVNRAATVERGQLVVELRVTPAAALAFLTVRLITGGPGGLAIEEF